MNTFTDRSKLILLPYDFLIIARTRRISLEELFSPKYADDCISKADKEYLIKLQEWIYRIFSPINADQSNGVYLDDTSEVFCNRIYKGDYSNESSFNLVDNKTIWSRLFSNNLPVCSIPPKLITLYDTPVAIIRPGQFTFTFDANRDNYIFTGNRVYKKQLLEDLISKLYIQLPQAVVHATVWYSLYIDLLAEEALLV